jgi:hypothetical protein
MLLDVGRVDDQAGCESKQLPGKGKRLGPRLPERRDAVVNHRVAEEPPREPVLALESVQVAAGVAARERQSGDEMMEYEVVQDDDPGAPAELGHDPAMRVGVVADMVEVEIGVGSPSKATAARDRHVDALPELGQEQSAVIRDPGLRRRQW